MTELVGAAVVGGFYAHTHEAIHVHYKCERCSHKFYKTYEIYNEDLGKLQDWG